MSKLSLIVPLSRSAFLLGVMFSVCPPVLLGAQEVGDGEGLVELVEALASAAVMAAREADMAARVKGQAVSAANSAFEAAREAGAGGGWGGAGCEAGGGASSAGGGARGGDGGAGAAGGAAGGGKAGGARGFTGGYSVSAGGFAGRQRARHYGARETGGRAAAAGGTRSGVRNVNPGGAGRRADRQSPSGLLRAVGCRSGRIEDASPRPLSVADGCARAEWPPQWRVPGIRPRRAREHRPAASRSALDRLSAGYGTARTDFPRSRPDPRERRRQSRAKVSPQAKTPVFIASTAPTTSANWLRWMRYDGVAPSRWAFAPVSHSSMMSASPTGAASRPPGPARPSGRRCPGRGAGPVSSVTPGNAKRRGQPRSTGWSAPRSGSSSDGSGPWLCARKTVRHESLSRDRHRYAPDNGARLLRQLDRPRPTRHTEPLDTGSGGSLVVPADFGGGVAAHALGDDAGSREPIRNPRQGQASTNSSMVPSANSGPQLWKRWPRPGRCAHRSSRGRTPCAAGRRGT